MFSIDFPEIIIIFGVALVVLGPKKLPGAVAKIGRWVGRARSMARQFREQLEQEVANAENAIDIRDSVDSSNERARQQSKSAPPETVAHGAEGHGAAAPESTAETAAHETTPYEPTPYHSMPEHSMPPPEGYGPAPQQLSFDEHLHDTALPPEGGVVASDPHPSDAHPSDVRDWMPETQTWMASAGWEVPDSSAGEAPESSEGSSSGSSATSGGAGEDETQRQRTETVGRHDR